MKTAKTKDAATLRRSIGRRLKLLTRFSATGKNPINFVREQASRTLSELRTLGIVIPLLLVCAVIARADDHDRDRRERHESHNYILERQQAYQVQGVPTSRIIVGKREIDVYRDGMMFEGNHVVGVRH